MKNIEKIKWVMILGVLIFWITACEKTHQKADAYGNFEIDRTFVSAKAQGELLWLHIEEGMDLKANEQIGQIDTMLWYYQKRQIIAQQKLIAASFPEIHAHLVVQKQQEKNIKVQQNRLNKLFAKDAATQKQLDDVQANLDLLYAQIAATKVKEQQLKEQIEAMNSQIATIDYQILNCRISSPLDGKVLNQFMRKGEMATPGKPLYSMANMQDIRLKVFVSGDQLPHIKIDQKVKVFIDENKKENKILPGVIVWISEKAEFTPKTVQTKQERVNLVYAVKIKVDNKGELKAGMPAEVIFSK